MMHPCISLLREALTEALSGDRTNDRLRALTATYEAAMLGALATLDQTTEDQRQLAALVDRPRCPGCGAVWGNAP